MRQTTPPQKHTIGITMKNLYSALIKKPQRYSLGFRSSDRRTLTHHERTEGSGVHILCGSNDVDTPKFVVKREVADNLCLGKENPLVSLVIENSNRTCGDRKFHKLEDI